jgi:hypothetical protein
VIDSALTPRERELVQEIARRTVQETLLSMGINTSSPEAIMQMQRDLQHLRDWRNSVEAIKNKGLITLVGIVVTGVAAALWLGTKQFLQQLPGGH